MQTLESLQRAIDASRQLKDIVRTMKVMASVSILQYEKAVVSLEHYGETVELGLLAIIRRTGLPAFKDRPGKRAAIVFGSDHGLCGRFNETLLEYVVSHLKSDTDVRLLALGGRADAGLEARGLSVEECFFVPGSVSGITLTVQQILLKIESWRDEGVETVDLFHQKPSGRGRYRPLLQRLLPLETGYFRHLSRRKWPGRALPGFTEEPTAVLASLLRQHLFISLFRASAESLAAEHGQRLISMQRAERNIGDRLDRLNLAYRQLRQEQITAELLEVVSGFEAVESSEAHGNDG